MEIGQHCCFHSCGRLDFLPFVCSSCGLVFCKEHCTPESHVCSQARSPVEGKELPANTSGAYTLTHQCTLDSCRRKEFVDFTCPYCEKVFCLAHRHLQDHSCTALQSKPSKTVHVREKEKSASRSAVPSTKKVLRGAKSESTRTQVSLMKMKMKAEGQDSIPQSERVYYEVQLPKQYKLPNMPMFFSKEWAVGRIIDFVAEKYRLRNENHKQQSQKLLLYSSDKEALVMSKPLHTLLEVIPTGSVVTLEYSNL